MKACLQGDGKILVAGQGCNPGKAEEFMAVRYNEDGNLDNSFGNFGIVKTDVQMDGNSDFCFAAAIQKDGKILLTGDSGYSTAIVRYNTDGEIDSTFGSNGVVLNTIRNSSEGRAIAIQQDGKPIVAGYCSAGTDNMLLRYNFTPVGVREEAALTEIFPNPGKGLFTINSPDAESVVVYNSIGQVCFCKKMKDLNSQIDLREYPLGIYSVEFRFNDRTIVRKIVLQ
jgi:uncharacterized delta-60 repeat protein